MNTKVSVDCFVEWWRGLTEPQKSAFAQAPTKVSAFLEQLAREIKEKENIFVTPLSDEEAIQLLVQQKICTQAEAEAIVRAWRKYASDMGYTGPVAWKVRQGFTLKTHAPLAGPCYDGLTYLQGWDFPDNPTTDCLVFWVPRLAPDSTNKTAAQMEVRRAQLRQTYGLPANHGDRFGSIGLLFALIQAYFRRMGERVPLNLLYAASDTLHAVGRRLVAGSFDAKGGLCCDCWRDSFGRGPVGFFLLGVEKLGQPAQEAGEQAIPTAMTVGGRTYDIVAFPQESEYVCGDIIVAEANKMGVNLGRDEGKHILKYQDQIPVALRDKVFVFTNWRHPDDSNHTRCICWKVSRWVKEWWFVPGHGWGIDCRGLRRRLAL